jgi:hypothetical protein
MAGASSHCSLGRKEKHPKGFGIFWKGGALVEQRVTLETLPFNCCYGIRGSGGGGGGGLHCCRRFRRTSTFRIAVAFKTGKKFAPYDWARGY